MHRFMSYRAYREKNDENNTVRRYRTDSKNNIPRTYFFARLQLEEQELL